jgi:membrane-bound lytic murein transglycosylase B
MTPGAVRPVHAADAAFTQFIASLWPEAQAAGVSRATFDAETRGLEPDYKLPDLLLPGRPATGAPSQAEFVQVPADYVKEASIARLAAEGQKLMQKHRTALTEIEKRFGVPASVVLARPTTAATGCLTTRCAWLRRRPMLAGARISTAPNSFSR